MCAHGHLKSEFLAQALVALYLCAIVMLGFGLAVPWHTQLSQTMHCVESYAKCDVQMASEAAAFVLVSGVITFLSILLRKRQLSILTYNTSLFCGECEHCSGPALFMWAQRYKAEIQAQPWSEGISWKD